MAKQAPADRQKRLDEGRHPIHGCGMDATRRQFVVVDALGMKRLGDLLKLGVAVDPEEALQRIGVNRVYICECPRGDCGIWPYEYDVDGSWELFAE